MPRKGTVCKRPTGLGCIAQVRVVLLLPLHFEDEMKVTVQADGRESLRRGDLEALVAVDDESMLMVPDLGTTGICFSGSIEYVACGKIVINYFVYPSCRVTACQQKTMWLVPTAQSRWKGLEELGNLPVTSPAASSSDFIGVIFCCTNATPEVPGSEAYDPGLSGGCAISYWDAMVPGGLGQVEQSKAAVEAEDGLASFTEGWRVGVAGLSQTHLDTFGSEEASASLDYDDFEGSSDGWDGVEMRLSRAIQLNGYRDSIGNGKRAQRSKERMTV